MLAAATTEDVTFVEKVRVTVGETKGVMSDALQTAGYTILPTHPTVSIMAIHHPAKNVAHEFASVGVMVEPGSAYLKTHHGWDDTYARVRVPAPDLTEELCRRISIIHA